MWLFHEAKYQFVNARKRAYVLSGTLLLAGVVAMIANVALIGSWQNYGVDFTGGSYVQVEFSQPTDVEQIRAALGGDNAPTITRFGADNAFVVRAPVIEGSGITEVAQDITSQLGASFGEGAFEVVSQDLVGPKIGGELQRKALGAILFSFVLTLIYIAIRFEFRFGVAAIIATVHDIMITLGLLAIFRVEISLPSVAAILTIVGYSLNDTIVVFDRIRENLAAKGGRREDPYRLVNRSINETLPRTVLTSGTTLAVLMSLLILGGPVIRDFTVVLILGVMIGTYSSIFVASPALLEIQNRWGNKQESNQKTKKAAAAV